MHLQELKETIGIPEGVTAEVAGSMLTVKGERGELTRKVGSKRVRLSVKDGTLELSSRKATRSEKALLRTGSAHARNMFRGVTEGHTYKLKVCSGHFPMSVSVKDGVFEVKNFIGEKVPRTIRIREGCEVKVEGDIVTVTSHDKEQAGNMAAAIELMMRRPGFDPRVFQDGIFIIEKDGVPV